MKKINSKLKDRLNNFKNTSFNNKRIIVLTIISVLALIALVSTTFAIFIVSGESSEKTLYSSGNLLVSFSDENSNAINLGVTKPVSDSYGMKTEPYTFTITNTGTLNATYEIVLTDEVISNPSGLTDEQVKENIKYMLNEYSPKLLSKFKSDNNLTGVIKPGQTLTFNLRMWIKREATNDIENTNYSTKIGVTGNAVRDTLLTYMLLGKETTDGYKKVTYASPNFNYNSTDRGLFVQQGDSTKSIDGKATYYFRGSSTSDTINPNYKMNNYVKFGKYQTTDGENIIGEDILWRVVRINEDGSIRLITENIVTNSTWNSQNTSNYVNGDGTDSELKSTIETWYNNNIGNIETLDDMVIESTFCSDISGNYTAANTRLNADTPTPIFTCPEGSTTVSSKSGTITADELVYSGFLVYKDTDQVPFLSSSNNYWTMTPINNNDIYLNVSSLNHIDQFANNTINVGVRVVINVKADALAVSGSGLSAKNAYVIK